jgi:hypothetical protein
MWQLSAWMAGYWNWCIHHAERMPRWKGHAITGVAVFLWMFVVFIADTWVVFATWVIVSGPVAVFGYAHRKVWKQRDERTIGRFDAAMKTKKLLKGTRFDK